MGSHACREEKRDFTQENRQFLRMLDIYALDYASLHTEMQPVQRMDREKVKNLVSLSSGFGSQSRFHDSEGLFLLISFYDIMKIKKPLSEKVYLVLLNPEITDSCNIAFVVNQVPESIAVNNKEIVKNATGNIMLPEVARSKYGDLLILDPVIALKKYRRDFLKENNFYSGHYPTFS